jgi:eukaryotic-like serine/threonine-protein kinase
MSDDFAYQGPLTATPAAKDGHAAGEESRSGPSTEPAGPAAVPRYRILGPLGIGGMGIVYRSEDTHLGRTVALKFLPPTLIPNPGAKARFLNEARAAAALDHPNICTIYEVGETAEGQLYLAMAYYEGETLKRRLGRGPLPVAEALRITLQVARGLAKAHRRGIVHRDIKPANLMITVEGMVKILDFGIARLPDETLPSPSLGTPGYMSPEQARGGKVDARSDVWSLGVVLREMLAGLQSGQGRQWEASSGQERPIPRLQPEIDALLDRMLAEEPGDRYPDAAALLADLSGLERATDPEGRPVPLPAPRRLPAWTGAVTLVALAVGGISVGLFREDHRPAGRAPEPSPATLPRLDRLTDLPGREWFPSLNPAGDLLVYARKAGEQSRLYWQRVGSGVDHELFPASLEGDSQPAISPDGQRIAFRSEREDGGIFLTRVSGGEVRRITSLGFNPAWSPDGKEIVFATEGVDNPRARRFRSQIYRFDLASSEQRLIQVEDAVQPSWSPHGLRIAYWSAFSSSGERVIWTVPANGGKPVRVTTGEHVDWNPVWSSDGRYLYFASDRSGVINLFRIPIDERSGAVGKPEPVTTSTQASMLFSVARFGNRIAYAGDETRTILERFAFDPATGAVAEPAVEIAQTPNLIATIDASRDGQWIVYQTSLPQEDLFVLRPDGTDLRQLTDDKHKDRQPRWSPDGKRIVFYSNRGDNTGRRYEVWTIRPDGSQLERAVIVRDRRVFHPIWSPNGELLACDFGDNEALIDLTQPLAVRRPQFLPPAELGMGFSASSWSADGRWLAGILHHPDERRVPGVVLYSPAERKYKRLTDRGHSATWLSDSRHLLYWDRSTLLLLDTDSKESRPVLTLPPGSEYKDFSLSPDDRVVYLARDNEQGDIWMLTLQ